MRAYISLLAVIVLLFFVCCQNPTETENTTDKTSSTSSTIPTDVAEVDFKNLSDYDVNVYVGITPYAGQKNCTVRKNSMLKQNLGVSEFQTVFYFEYLIPVGNLTFPSYSGKVNTGYKTQLLEGGKSQIITIEKLDQSETDSAFILIENKSGSDYYLKNIKSKVSPVGKETYDVHNGSSAVYEINDDSLLHYDDVSGVRCVINATKELPLPINSVEKGMIYSMVVTADAVTLKAKTPFNIDLQNQIWTKRIGSQYNVQCVRQDNEKEGVVVISTGVNQPNVIQYDKYNKYGNNIFSRSFQYTMQDCTVDKVDIFDCMELADGSIVMLARMWLDDEYGPFTEAHLLNYDFTVSSRKFDWTFDDNYNWMFRSNMQNSIAKVSDGVYAVVGGRYDDDYCMSAFIAKVDTTGQNVTAEIKVSDVTSDASPMNNPPKGVQTMFTSVYYDGNDFYACGYENCDFQYGSNIHKGVIYKISNDLQNMEKVYTKDKTLLFGIVGKDNHYWACGEYADSGNILKGCLVSDSTNDMQIFTADLGYHWFNQISISSDKLLLCGPTSQNKDGSGTAYSVVTAVNMSSGKTEWTNTFEDYADALSCIPNGIGSYIVQLKGNSGTTIKSADLLGR